MDTKWRAAEGAAGVGAGSDCGGERAKALTRAVRPRMNVRPGGGEPPGQSKISSGGG